LKVESHLILDSGSSDQFPVGDISGRYSDLPHAFTDLNLPLHGAHSVYGKLVKLVLQDGTSVCTQLRKDTSRSTQGQSAKGLSVCLFVHLSEFNQFEILLYHKKLFV